MPAVHAWAVGVGGVGDAADGGREGAGRRRAQAGVDGGGVTGGPGFSVEP